MVMKIKKCPFCGCPDCYVVSDPVEDPDCVLWYTFVSCPLCEARGPLVVSKIEPSAKILDDAVTYWGRRGLLFCK